jgi:glycosyltransferase involved in cell wall biosynthesis
MIVRDEAEFLPECLASIKAHVDEIVVVDTGSTDTTREIAARAGARVAKVPWRDDFAAARNESIARAKGDWILMVDADERLAPHGGAAIRQAIARGGFDCGLLPLHEATRTNAGIDEVLSGKARIGEIGHLPRLLRHTADLRFTGIVHETILPWLRGRGMKTSFVPGDLVHLGAALDVRSRLAKAERNIRLLERLAESEANDPTPLGYLAHDYLELGRGDDARRAIARGWSRLASAPQHISVLRLATARVRLQLEAGDNAGALLSVAEAEAIDGPHPDFDFLRGTAEEMRAITDTDPAARTAGLEAASAAYGAAIARRDQIYMQRFVRGAATWAAQTRLGTTELLLGRLGAARAAFEAALALLPDHLEARLGLIECLLEDGRYGEVLARIEPLLGEGPDAWLLAAAAASALGATDDLRALLARARALSSKGYLAPHRVARHIRLHVELAARASAPRVTPARALL